MQQASSIQSNHVLCEDNYKESCVCNRANGDRNQDIKNIKFCLQNSNFRLVYFAQDDILNNHLENLSSSHTIAFIKIN